jgi:hypothetical protein
MRDTALGTASGSHRSEDHSSEFRADFPNDSAAGSETRKPSSGTATEKPATGTVSSEPTNQTHESHPGITDRVGKTARPVAAIGAPLAAVGGDSGSLLRVDSAAKGGV